MKQAIAALLHITGHRLAVVNIVGRGAAHDGDAANAITDLGRSEGGTTDSR